jgi:hypothetical protein
MKNHAMALSRSHLLCKHDLIGTATIVKLWILAAAMAGQGDGAASVTVTKITPASAEPAVERAAIVDTPCVSSVATDGSGLVLAVCVSFDSGDVESVRMTLADGTVITHVSAVQCGIASGHKRPQTAALASQPVLHGMRASHCVVQESTHRSITD